MALHEPQSPQRYRSLVLYFSEHELLYHLWIRTQCSLSLLLPPLLIRPLLLILLLLPLALQPAVGFGLSKNVPPFCPICHQLSPSSHSQHLTISFYFFSPSFPGPSPSFHPFQFLSEDLFLGILSSSILFRWPNQIILCPFTNFTIFSPLLISSSS
jgi:hypothetical protein